MVQPITICYVQSFVCIGDNIGCLLFETAIKLYKLHYLAYYYTLYVGLFILIFFFNYSSVKRSHYRVQAEEYIFPPPKYAWRKRKDSHLSLFCLLYLPWNDGILLRILRTMINTQRDNFQEHEFCGVKKITNL